MLCVLAEYKKKNVKKIKLNKAAPAVKKQKPIKVTKPQQVEMKPAKTVAPKPKKVVKSAPKKTRVVQPKVSKKETNYVQYNVIIGEKAKQAAKKLKKFTFVAVIVAAIVIASLLTPTGIFETLHNAYLSIGSADFPRELTGSQTVSSEYRNDKLYVITDMAYTVYNSKGKTIMSDTHGFSKPFMKVADARTLLLDQNGSGYKIYNLNGAVVTQSITDNIITGDISRNGTYAIVSKPPDYAAKVDIYSKNNKLLFSWSSSQEIVTAVCLSNNGKKVAVSTIYSNAGEYTSKVYVFNYKNASPIMTISYDQPVLYLKTLNASSFVSITAKKLDFVKWGSLKTTSVETEGNIKDFRYISSSEFLVSCESSMNNLETKCTVYNSRFQPTFSALFAGSAEDVSFVGNRLFCFDDNITYVINKDGNTVGTAECGYSVRHVFAKNGNSLLAVSDTEVRKVVVED